MSALSDDFGYPEAAERDPLDLLEQGYSSLYNPNLLRASTHIPSRHGLKFCENVIRRDKASLTFVMYQQLEKPRVNSGAIVTPKTQQGLL